MLYLVQNPKLYIVLRAVRTLDLKWICDFISAFRGCHQFEFCFNLEYAINFDYVSFFGDNAAAHNKGRNERNVGWYSMWQSNNTEVGSFFTCFPLPRRLTSLETDIIASGKEMQSEDERRHRLGYIVGAHFYFMSPSFISMWWEAVKTMHFSAGLAVE